MPELSLPISIDFASGVCAMGEEEGGFLLAEGASSDSGGEGSPESSGEV